MEPTAAPEKPKGDYADLDVQQGKKQKGKGKLGSLENPEVYENVPGHVIPAITREFDDFDTEAASFMRGDQTEEQFIGFRLKQGVYGQRQPDVQMIRVKLPLGGVTPDQMDAFASVIEKYAPLNKGHITTRQNIQIHHVPLPDAAKLIRELSDADLSSREGCGNTVRNVTGDPRAGVSEGEPFDITPYAIAYVRYFVRHPTTQLMPRKIKTAFTATDEDVAITGIHDIGFIPGARRRQGRRDPGRRRHLDHAADRADALRVRRARQRRLPEGRPRPACGSSTARSGCASTAPGPGSRSSSTRSASTPSARWSRKSSRATGSPSATSRSTISCSTPTRRRRSSRRRCRRGTAARTATAPSSTLSSRRTSCRSARRASRRSTVKVTRGDLTPEQFRGLGQIMRDYTGGYARTTVQQNFVLRWVRDEAVYDVWQRLGELGLGETGRARDHRRRQLPRHRQLQARDHQLDGPQPGRPGADRVDGHHRPADPQIHVKMCGCPNGCGQHHIATIGFYGASIKVGEHTIPAYIAHVGGTTRAARSIYGKRLKVAPAREARARRRRALDPLLRGRAQRRRGLQRLRRPGRHRGVRGDASRTSPCRSSSTSRTCIFIDWARNDPYQVERGEGECAV